MSGSKIAVIVAALVLVAGAIVIVSLKVGGTGTNEPSQPERVRLEIRASEAAKIVMNGKAIGQTPLSIYVPKNGQQITLEATMVEHWATRAGQMVEPERHMKKTIVADHDQVIDFIPPKGPPPP